MQFPRSYHFRGHTELNYLPCTIFTSTQHNFFAHSLLNRPARIFLSGSCGFSLKHPEFKLSNTPSTSCFFKTSSSVTLMRSSCKSAKKYPLPSLPITHLLSLPQSRMNKELMAFRGHKLQGQKHSHVYIISQLNHSQHFLLAQMRKIREVLPTKIPV